MLKENFNALKLIYIPFKISKFIIKKKNQSGIKILKELAELIQVSHCATEMILLF